MTFLRSCHCLLLIVAAAIAGAGSLASAAEFKLNAHTFTLPDGFVIEEIAGPPLVDRPVTAAFDEQGRLYVTDSSGSNDKPDKQLVDKPHRVLRLEDTDGDGKFDKRTVFADKMMFPEGTMWLDGSVYVAAPPSIWKLTDTNDDGVADERVEWFKGKTLTGCANDLHGPYRGPDGWIYWAKGAFAEQTYERPGKKPLVTKAAHIFRCRPDGSGIEPVMTGGMDNPVDVVFTPGGERIFTTTFLQNPGGGRRDGLIHAIYGGVYGKIHDPMEHAPRTGDILPTLVHLGPAAPCGLVRVESDALGAGYENNLFACQFNRARVSRHALKPNGATFDATNVDFVVSNNLDFHPTDIIEDADGSLVICDTGGWYKLCCPTSQLPKPDVLGAVYRVRRKDAKKLDDPRGLKIDWAKLDADQFLKLLGDGRPVVRQRAADVLVRQGAGAVPILAKALASNSTTVRLSAVWALTRINHADARNVVRTALSDQDETIRQAALHSISVWKDHDALPLLLTILGSGSAQNERAAAEAIGRIGDKEAVDPLFMASGKLGAQHSGSAADSGPSATDVAKALERDRILEHSLTFALIEIGDARHSEAALIFGRGSWTTRAALISLDQMEGSKLNPDVVAQLLSAPDLVMKDAAAWIIGRHPEWGSALVNILREKIETPIHLKAELEEFETLLAKFAVNPEVQELLGSSLTNNHLEPDQISMIFRVMRASGVKMPEAWRARLAEMLTISSEHQSERNLDDVVKTIRSLPTDKDAAELFKPGLLAIGMSKNAKWPSELRLEALAAIPDGLREIDDELFHFLLKGLRSDVPVVTRSAVAGVLSKARLNSAQLIELCDQFNSIGPLEADKLLGAYEQSADEAVGAKLIAALKASPALTSLRVDSIRTRLAKQSDSVKSKAEELYAVINIDLAQQKQKLEEMLPTLKSGDIRRGQEVFRREKSACITCHGFGYVGGNVGPDLTRIGGIRTERDLLEAILFPSASFVRSFEPVSVVTASGKTYNGVVKKDAADEVVLATTATEIVRIPREDVEEMVPSSVSVMPAGLDKQLTPQELADLIAFLKNAK